MAGASRSLELEHTQAAWVHGRRSHAWIEDSAVFGVARTLPVLSQQAWWDWPEGLRFRKPEALAEFR